jgi:hypothetical protein
VTVASVADLQVFSATRQPLLDLVRVETHQFADLQVWHTFLGDQAAHVADGDAETIGELVDGEYLGNGAEIGHCSPCLLFTSVLKLQPPLLLYKHSVSDTAYLWAA